MFSFGTGNVLWKLPQRSLRVFNIISLRTLVSLTLIGGIMLYLNQFQGSLSDWFWAVIISVFSFLGLAFYNLSIKYSTVSQSITTTSISALFGVLTSVLLYDESISWNLILSMILIVLSLFLLEDKKPMFKWSKGTFFALLAAFFWGTTFALFKIPVQSIGEINFSFVLELTVLVSAFIFGRFFKGAKPKENPTMKTYLIIGLIGILGFIGVVSYNIAVILIDVSVLSIMGAFTPIISIVLSHIILKERFKTIQYLGMSATLIAVLLLLI